MALSKNRLFDIELRNKGNLDIEDLLRHMAELEDEIAALESDVEVLRQDYASLENEVASDVV